ncbi:MAG: HlyD family secretion protein [Spirochaetales bacterium]|nr:HlyD family secretion protein [Spirochaetales bacterium]
MAENKATDAPAPAANAQVKPPVGQTAAAGGNGKSGFPFPPGKRRRPIIIGAIVIAVLVAVLAVVGIVALVDNALWVGTDDASIDGQKVNISASMLGRIKAILVHEGERVTVGRKLIELDDSSLRAQEASAAAQLESAKVNRDGREEDLKRAKALYSGGAMTKQQFDAASFAFDAAAAQYNIAQAQLNLIETQLANTVIISPIDGTATRPAFSVGDVVQPGQTILAVNNLDKVWVTANFEETKVGRIEVGADVDVTVDKYPGLPFRGKVTSISSGVLPAPFQIGEFTKTTRRVPIRIDFTSIPEGVVLQPGLSVEVRVRAK